MQVEGASTSKGNEKREVVQDAATMRAMIRAKKRIPMRFVAHVFIHAYWSELSLAAPVIHTALVLGGDKRTLATFHVSLWLSTACG